VIRLASSHLHLGEFGEARRWIDKIGSHPAMKDGKLRLIASTLSGVAAAREGRSADVEGALAAIRGATARVGRHVGAAFVLVAAGREDEAFDELDLALAMHDPWLYELPAEPLMAPVRPHPRFRQMLEVMGLGSGVAAR